MPRRMADPGFRGQQWDARFAPHIAAINSLVDALCDGDARPRPPYVAPMYGGANARILSFLRDPGPATQEVRHDGRVGSGFLCMENDDPTAERTCRLFAAAGIPALEIVPWNAYPWYINRNPKAAELEEGIGPLRKLLDLMPKLRVVMLHGGAARDSWRRFERRFPMLVADRGLVVLPTYHTSRQAFWHPSAEERARRLQHLEDAFTRAAILLGYVPSKSNSAQQASVPRVSS